jgi:uncharacterized integral membrane protein
VQEDDRRKGDLKPVKYKIFFFLFIIFLLAHLYFSYLNPDSIKLYVGSGKYYETTLANYIAASFVVGVIVTIIAGFFADAGRVLQKRGQDKKERKKQEEEARELLAKPELQDKEA